MAKKNSKATKAGAGALLLGLLTWAVGPISKENALEWVKILAFAISLALLIRWPFIEPFKIPSGSMEPTLSGDDRFLRGDRVFVNKWIYGVRYPFTKTRIWRGQEPERWDIVVFKTPKENARHKTLVKRVVGLPGERIHVDLSGHVTVNGTPIEAPPGVGIRYGAPPSMGDMLYGVLQEDAYSVVPPDHYLVLGDNRGNSADGRVFGWLPNGNILGRVACIAWPPAHWRDFTGFTKTWWWRTLLVLTGALVLVRLFLGRSWHVRRGASGDGLSGGEHLYVNRAAYGVPVPFTEIRMTRGRAPERGELVLYRPPQNAETDHEILVGRVAGLAGEQVYIDGGKLTINGRPVQTPQALAERTFGSTNGAAGYGLAKNNKGLTLVPEGHYFILGGDGGSAVDSRVLGWVPRKDLIGPIAAVWWPPRRWRRVRM